MDISTVEVFSLFDEVGLGYILLFPKTNFWDRFGRKKKENGRKEKENEMEREIGKGSGNQEEKIYQLHKNKERGKKERISQEIERKKQMMARKTKKNNGLAGFPFGGEQKNKQNREYLHTLGTSPPPPPHTQHIWFCCILKKRKKRVFG